MKSDKKISEEGESERSSKLMMCLFVSVRQARARLRDVGPSSIGY